MTPEDTQSRLAAEPLEPTAAQEPAAAQPNTVRLGLGRAIAIAVIALAGTLLGAYLIARVSALGWGDTASALAIGGLMLAIYAPYVLLAWLAARRRGSSLAHAVSLALPRRPWAWLGMAIGGAVLARLLTLVYSIILVALNLVPSSEQLPNISRVFPPGLLGGVVAVLAIGVVAPFAEEIVFRGVLLSAIRSRWGTAAAIVVSSLVFALAHFSVFEFVPILLTAFILGWLYVRSGSLWVSIAAHSAYNLVALVALFLLPSGV